MRTSWVRCASPRPGRASITACASEDGARVNLPPSPLSMWMSWRGLWLTTCQCVPIASSTMHAYQPRPVLACGAKSRR